MENYLKSNIEYMKKKNGISYRELCRQTNISRPSIQNILKLDDSSRVTVGTVIKLSEYFNVSLENLLFKDLSSAE